MHETYPAAHIREYTEKSLENLGVDCIDLSEFKRTDNYKYFSNG